MRNKCKIINVQRNAKHLWYKGQLKLSAVRLLWRVAYNFVQYIEILRLFTSLSRIMVNWSHVICACCQNMSQHLFASCKFAINNFAERLYTSYRKARGIYIRTALCFAAH